MTSNPASKHFFKTLLIKYCNIWQFFNVKSFFYYKTLLPHYYQYTDVSYHLKMYSLNRDWHIISLKRHFVLAHCKMFWFYLQRMGRKRPKRQLLLCIGGSRKNSVLKLKVNKSDHVRKLPVRVFYTKKIQFKNYLVLVFSEKSHPYLMNVPYFGLFVFWSLGCLQIVGTCTGIIICAIQIPCPTYTISFAVFIKVHSILRLWELISIVWIKNITGRSPPFIIHKLRLI